MIKFRILIRLFKPQKNSITKRLYMTPKVSGGAPFLTCACAYELEKNVPGLFISMKIPCTYKLSYVKQFFIA